MSYDSVNPYTGKVHARYDEHTDEQMEQALHQANARYASFGTIADRTAVLRKAAALMIERREELATLITLEMGKLINDSRDEVSLSASILEYFADNAAGFLAPRPLDQFTGGTAWVEFQPIGVLIGVEPWNYPYYQLVRFVGPNLAAGNPILMKHAPGVPQCALAFEKVMLDAGAPSGAYTNLFLTNDQVSKLIVDERIQGVALTGSERAGESLAAQAGKALKKSTMELGGNDAFVVLEDFDPKVAAQLAVKGRMINTGQACCGSKRFIVVEKIADAFIEEVLRLMAEYEPGDPMDEATSMGPVSSKAALDRLMEQLSTATEHGATILLGGERAAGPGAFLQPTVLTDIAPSNPVFHQEFFGPVAMFFRAKDEDEAIAIANDSPFGLGGAVCTLDPERAKQVASRLQSGMVFINFPALTLPELPFGGVKRSGYGRELSGFGIEEFVNKKLVCIPDISKIEHVVA